MTIDLDSFLLGLALGAAVMCGMWIAALYWFERDEK